MHATGNLLNPDNRIIEKAVADNGGKPLHVKPDPPLEGSAFRVEGPVMFVSEWGFGMYLRACDIGRPAAIGTTDLRPATRDTTPREGVTMATETLSQRLRSAAEGLDCGYRFRDSDLLRAAVLALDAAARREEALYTALDGLLQTVIDECGDPDEADDCELLDAVRTAQAAIAAAKEAQP